MEVCFYATCFFSLFELLLFMFFAVGVLQVMFLYFCVRLLKLILFVGTTEWLFVVQQSWQADEFSCE